jgi:hypothetical protein
MIIQSAPVSAQVQAISDRDASFPLSIRSRCTNITEGEAWKKWLPRAMSVVD